MQVAVSVFAPKTSVTGFVLPEVELELVPLVTLATTQVVPDGGVVLPFTVYVRLTGDVVTFAPLAGDVITAVSCPPSP